MTKLKFSATHQTISMALLSAALGVFLLLATSSAMARVTTCTVVSITDKEVVMQCNKAENLKKGDKVRVKPVAGKKAIEGC